MFIIGIILFCAFPIWGIWLIISLMVGNSMLTPIRIYRMCKTNYAFRKNEQEYRMVLFSRVPYYKKLQEEYQTQFYKRVKKFVRTKEFIPVDMAELSELDKMLIAASAIQLTFGLDAFLLSRFHTIYVYPKHFYNPKTKNTHKGEVNLHGTISISLKDFHLGNQDESDGINLGLHEMAHALRVEQFLEQDSDDFFNSYFAKISHALEEEISNELNNDFIRAYGKTNAHEFFAVCVENFFERPLKFKGEMPELYAHFVVLLNQDPLHLNTSFETSRAVKEDENLGDINHGDVLFSKGFSLNYFMLIGILFIGFKTYPSLTIPGLFLAVYLFVKVLNYRKVTFYSNGILVKPWYTSTPFFYSYSRIVLVLVTEGKIKQFVLKYRNQSQIKNTLIPVSISEQEKKQWFELLKSNKISVKYVGRL